MPRCAIGANQDPPGAGQRGSQPAPVPAPHAPGPGFGAQRAMLPGGRWHFQHGPIDIVIDAQGDAAPVQAAHDAAWARFQGVLAELVAELSLLRQPVDRAAAGLGHWPGMAPRGAGEPGVLGVPDVAGVAGLPGAADGVALSVAMAVSVAGRKAVAARPGHHLHGPIARCMWQACAPLVAEADGYLTPMAAVAGAVAQALIPCYQRAGVLRAWVNNGGDIALHLAPGQQTRLGVFADLARLDAQAAGAAAAGGLAVDAHFDIRADQPVRGVATSGWRGRSHSRGIADSVTVLAATAAQADAAATVIANAVGLPAALAAAAGIVQRPARQLRDDSDLGDIPVTVAVPPLAEALVQQALQRGLACAGRLQAAGQVHAVLLACQGRWLRLPPAAAHGALNGALPAGAQAAGPASADVVALADAAALVQ